MIKNKQSTRKRSERKKALRQIIGWLLAALVLFVVFSNKDNSFSIRILVVSVLTVMSFLFSTFINQYLIPKFLFKDKHFLFIYQLLFGFVISAWINILCIMLILWQTANQIQHGNLPTKTDLILLLSGSYLIILFATVVHFIRESYRKTIEKDRVLLLKAESELRLKEARLKLLQGQLHPHFLFNMLNNLYGLWIEKSDNTPDVILKLSSLLDYMLYQSNREMVSLQEEIDFLKNYLDLERIRHDDRLKLDCVLPDETYGLPIGPLLLFTFVENAFKHGVNNHPGSGQISLSLQCKPDEISFSIRNYYSIIGNQPERPSGIGLRNVEERLKLLYPNQHQLDISDHDHLFDVTLILHIQ